MTTPAERAVELYFALRPGAIKAYNDYFLTRTPADIQPEMYIELAPDTPKVMMSNGQPCAVVDSDEVEVPGSPGVCVIDESLTGGHVKLAEVP
jgi:hypothetical protein